MGVFIQKARTSPQKRRTLSPKRGLVRYLVGGQSFPSKGLAAKTGVHQIPTGGLDTCRHSLVVPERLAWDHWIPGRSSCCQLVVENVASRMVEAHLKIVKGSEVFSIAASSKQLLLAPGMRHSCKVI